MSSLAESGKLINFAGMKIIIAGSGQTAVHLARILSVEGQDVVLIDRDDAALARLEAEYNFLTMTGEPIDMELQRRADVGEAGIFVAVTPSESHNIIAAQMARSLGARCTVARIDSPFLKESLPFLQSTGVDLCIYPERLIAQEAARFIKHNAMHEWLPLVGGEVLVTATTLHESSSLCGIPLRQAAGPDRRFHIVAVRRGERLIIPRGDDVLHAGDHIFFAVLPQDADSVAKICGAVMVKPRRIMITGAGRVTENLLKMIQGECRATVIDPDADRCRSLAARFPDVAVVCARASDLPVLQEEGIARCDIFMALTGSSEANIVACMVAHQCGVPKTLARIEQLEYMAEADSLNIDKIINKKLINAGAIMQLLLDADPGGAQCFSLDYAEVVSMRVGEGSVLTGTPLSRLRLPQGVTVAAVITPDGASVAGGNTVINGGDRVVFFCTAGSLSRLRKLGSRHS